MKKVFFSLAALAFVATGAFSVASCGDDNGTQPVTPPTPASAGSFVLNNKTYTLDNTVVLVDAEKDNAGNNSIIGYSVDIDGDGTQEIATKWTFISYNGDDMSASENYTQYRIYVPVNGDKLVFPDEAETVYYADGLAVFAGDAQNPADIGTSLTSFSTTINSLDIEGSTVKYAANFTTDTSTFNLNYDGVLAAASFRIITPPSAQAKENINGKIDLSKTESIDLKNAKLVLKK